MIDCTLVHYDLGRKPRKSLEGEKIGHLANQENIVIEQACCSSVSWATSTTTALHGPFIVEPVNGAQIRRERQDKLRREGKEEMAEGNG
jgi:hypothetical protein